MAPDAIPEEMLIRGAAGTGPVLSSVVGDPLLLSQAIAVLRTYSFVRRDPCTRMLSTHRLVQAVLMDEMEEATLFQWMERVIRTSY